MFTMLTTPPLPTAVTKARLLSLIRKTPGAWLGLKIAALVLVLEGQRPRWIADVLGVTRMSLYRWVRGVQTEGLAALQPKPHPGRPSRLSPRLRQRLGRHLAQSPQAVGLNRARWDGPTLAEYLKRQCGVPIKVRQAQHWLHQLGYRLKRASHVYLQAKAADAQRFQRALKKTAHPGSPRDGGLPR